MNYGVKTPEMTKFQEYVSSENWKMAQELLKEQDLFDPLIRDYNQSLLYFKQGRLLEARYTLEKVMTKGFINQESNLLLNSLIEAQGLTGIRTEYGIEDNVFLNSKSIDGSVYLSVFLVFVLVFTIGIVKSQKLLAWAGGILMVFFIAFYYQIQLGQLALSQEEMVIYEGPSKIFEQVQTIPRGLKIIYEEPKKGWIKILYPKYLQGWATNAKVMKL